MLLKLLNAHPSRHQSPPPRERSLTIRLRPMFHRKMLNKLRALAGNLFKARLMGDRVPLLKGMEARGRGMDLREGARRTVLCSRTNRRSIGNTTSHRVCHLKERVMKTLDMPVRILTACILPLFRKNQT